MQRVGTLKKIWNIMIHEMTDQGTEFPEEGVYIVPGDVVSKKSQRGKCL